MILSVAPLLVWAWLNSENEPQKPNADEGKQAAPSSAVVVDKAAKRVRAKKNKMSRNQAFQVLIEHGFQPQIPTKKIRKLEIYAQESGDRPLKKITLGAVNKKPILIHFWATWCGPCKMAEPILEELSNEYKDKVIVVKVDVDQNQEESGKLGIMSIPTTVLFKGGKEIGRQVGFAGKQAFEDLIKKGI